MGIGVVFSSTAFSQIYVSGNSSLNVTGDAVVFSKSQEEAKIYVTGDAVISNKNLFVNARIISVSALSDSGEALKTKSIVKTEIKDPVLKIKKQSVKIKDTGNKPTCVFINANQPDSFFSTSGSFSKSGFTPSENLLAVLFPGENKRINPTKFPENEIMYVIPDFSITYLFCYKVRPPPSIDLS